MGGTSTPTIKLDAGDVTRPKIETGASGTNHSRLKCFIVERVMINIYGNNNLVRDAS
jgi:hypothetical protein